MLSEAAMTQLRLDREFQREHLAALEAEREKTSSSYHRDMLGFRIRTLTQHLHDFDAVLDSQASSRIAENGTQDEAKRTNPSRRIRAGLPASPGHAHQS
jgi:hypothetical protein